MMKTLNEYLAMPYRMEVVEDIFEGGFVEPNIIEEFNPDRTILVLEFNKKATEKFQQINVTEKTQNQINIILNYMINDKWYKASEFINVLNLQETRTKEILRLMVELGLLESNNLTKGKMYRKIKN